MEKLYEINDKLAKIWKLGKLQLFFYPMVCFGLLAIAIIIIELFNYFVN